MIWVIGVSLLFEVMRGAYKEPKVGSEIRD
jgi:hypothetical protein